MRNVPVYLDTADLIVFKAAALGKAYLVSNWLLCEECSCRIIKIHKFSVTLTSLAALERLLLPHLMRYDKVSF